MPEPKPTFTREVRFLDRRAAPHLLTLILLAGSSALSLNIFLPSLPMIATYFEADFAVIQLAVSAFLGLTAVFQVILGPLADRYGRRPVMIGGYILFLLATLGCLFSTNEIMFLGFRFLQAAIAAGTVLSRTMVRDLFDGDKAAQMLSYVTMGMALMPMIGPIIGGALEASFGWQASFVALFLMGLITLVVAFFDLPETNPNENASFAKQFKQYPDLLRSRRFWGYSLTGMFASGGFFAFLGGGAYVAVEVYNLSPVATGLGFAITPMGYMIGNFLSGRFTGRFGRMSMIRLGTALSSAGMAVALIIFLLGFGSPWVLFSLIFFVGLGNGFTMPSSQIGLMSVNPRLAGSAAGLGGALMIGGGGAMAAITGAIMRPETAALQLIGMILASSLASMAMAQYTHRVERAVAAQPS